MQGLRSVRRDPATFLLEVLWRWCFGIVALFILVFAIAALLHPMHVTDRLLTALRNQDSRTAGTLGLFIVLQYGVRLAAGLIAIALTISLVWSLFAAPARRIIVRRISQAEPLRFGSMFALQWARAMALLFAALLLLAALAGALYAATRSSQPDLFRFYSISWPSGVVIVVIWLVLNWYLSMAAIFGRERQGFRGALRAAWQIAQQQRSDFAGTAFLFLLLRLVVLLAAIAIIGLTSSMMATAPQTYAALVMTVALFYFVISDFLYAARIASYLALADAHTATSGTKPSSVFKVEKSSLT